MVCVFYLAVYYMYVIMGCQVGKKDYNLGVCVLFFMGGVKWNTLMLDGEPIYAIAIKWNLRLVNCLQN